MVAEETAVSGVGEGAEEGQVGHEVAQPAARRADAVHLPHERHEAIDVLEDVRREDLVEGAVAERQRRLEVEHDVDARQRHAVDVDVARADVAAAA